MKLASLRVVRAEFGSAPKKFGFHLRGGRTIWGTFDTLKGQLDVDDPVIAINEPWANLKGTKPVFVELSEIQSIEV